MKKLIYFILICGYMPILHAQNYVLQARAADNTCRQLNIRIEQGIAYVHLSDIPEDALLTPMVYDLSGLGIQDGTITIPEDGNTYWLVNFDNPEMGTPVEETRICVKCKCLDQEPGCRLTERYVNGRHDVGCANYGCNACMLYRVPCGLRSMSGDPSGDTIAGSFAIIKANKIVFE